MRRAEITGQTQEQIVDRLMTLEEGARFMVMAPVVRGRKGEYGKLLEQMRLEGYSRVKVDGELRRLDEEIVLDKKYKHDISVVVDRLVMKPDLRRRLSESVEAAAGLAGGPGRSRAGRPRARPSRCSSREQFACLNCGTSIPELEPRIFSFNSPHGACERCHGLGFQRVIDPELVVPDPTLSLAEGALQPWNRGVTAYWRRLIAAVAEENGVDVDKPWSKLKKSEREIFLYGTGGERHQVTYTNRFGRRRSYRVRFEGIVNQLAAPLRGDRLRDQPRADRGLHGRAALPGVRGRAAAAGEPRGQGRRDQHRRVQRAVGAGGAASGSRRWS